MGQLTDKLYAATEKMERDLSKIPADAKKAMAYSHDHLIPDMEKARELADRLEELTPAERWPFPVYSDLPVLCVTSGSTQKQQEMTPCGMDASISQGVLAFILCQMPFL